jgi:phosphoglycolate phosphatase-like HAD superfamily hydrolase
MHLLFVLAILSIARLQAVDFLPSWNEGSAKQKILQFAEKASTPGDPDFIPQEDRIAAFDQDGTLWVEHPLYTQFYFAFSRIKAEAANHPEWESKEPFRSVIHGDKEKIEHFTLKEIEQLIADSHSGMTVETFDQLVEEWLKTAKHPRFDKPFTSLVYQPMLETIQLLKDKGFKVYIVSGGGQAFIRVYANRIYGIPPEQVIGSAGKVRYNWNQGHPELLKLPEILFIDDHAGKPEGIYLVIGKPPVITFGNSDGDQQMLEWTTSGKKNRLGILVHHDDPVREYAYDSATKIGTFSEALMSEAKQEKWVVVSMKDDWKVIFPTHQ